MPIEVPEGAQILSADANKLGDIYAKLAQTRGVFDDFTKNPEYFFKLYFAKDTVWLERTDGNGILYLTNVIPGLSALAHIVYWDKRLGGREAFTLDCLRWGFTNIGLKKVNVWMPEFAKAAIHFARKLGFQFEGKVRRWSYSQGRTYDILMYGMTNEEAFSGQQYAAVQPDIERVEQQLYTEDDGDQHDSPGSADPLEEPAPLVVGE